MAQRKPLVLVILDGFGERPETDGNAIKQAKTPVLTDLYRRYPHTLIGASGPDVGLPKGQMGNSEVGHLNFGAGRVAQMDISRIDNAVADGTLLDNPVIGQAVGAAKASGGSVHLLGLVSDGGVHSSLEHLLCLVKLIEDADVPVYVHAFLDGRDVAPGSAPGFVERVRQSFTKPSSRIASVSGRFYAMDRDNRWERVQQAYDAIVHGKGARFASADAGIADSLGRDVTDEFVVPFVVGDYPGVRRGVDTALHFNFRPDRARELTAALATAGFDAFARVDGAPFAGRYACMTTYDAKLELPVAFPKDVITEVFPEILANHGLTQFRCAETEKYAHVTYFFNGGREEPFAGEERKVVPSRKDVATYDLAPAMSAEGVTDAVVAAIDSGRFDFVLVNYANPDMVGHSGVLDAAVEAVQVVDTSVGRLVEAALAKDGQVFVTADHGNCETMLDPTTGNPHTAHTLNPVPFLWVGAQARPLRDGGRLADVAPTLLALLGLAQPAAMTGESLLATSSA